MSNMSDDAFRRLEEGAEKHQTALADKRARRDELARAIARGASEPTDDAELQAVVSEIAMLEKSLEAQEGALRSVRNEREKIAAEERAAADLARRRRASDESIAALAEYERIVGQVEAGTAQLIALIRELRTQEHLAAQPVLALVHDERQRELIARGSQSLSPELDNLVQFLSPRDGGASIHLGPVAGAAAQTTVRVERLAQRIREALGLTSDAEG